MAEAALISALEGRPLVLRGARGPRARPSARRLLRALDERRERAVIARAHARRGARARRPHGRCCVEAPPPSFAERQQAWARPHRRRRRARRRGEVPALDRADRRGRRGRPAGRRRARRRRPEPRRPRPRRAPGLVLAARRAGRRGSRPATAGTTSSCPSASSSCCSRSRAYLRHRDRVLSEWGYERTVARTQGLKVLFAGESGTGKTMAAQVLAAELGLDLFRVDLATVVSQVHRRDREEPRPHLRRRRGLQRDPVLRRGRRAVRQALGGHGRPRPLREHRGRLPAAEDGGLRGRGHPRDELPPQHRRRVRAPAGLRDRLPVPRGRGPRADLARCCCPRRRRSPTTSTSTSSPRSFKLSGGAIRNCSLAAAFLAADDGGVIEHAPPRARGRAGVRQAGPAHARGRLRAASTS